MDLGNRHAEATEIGDRVTEVLGADDFISRTYLGRDGRQILMHAAVWSGEEYVATLAPHPPQVCYTGAGWEILEQRTVDLETPHGTYPCAFILFERDGERIVTAHWYQMGRHHFTTRDEARKLHRRLWGQSEWPPTLKILLQVTSFDLSSAQAEIVPFAQELLKHTILSDSQS
jgi:EpsI family protein